MESGDIVKYLRSTGERKILKPVYLCLLLWHSPRPDPSSEWLQGFEPFIKNRNLRGGKEAMSFRLDSTEPPVLSEVLLRVQNAYLGFLLRCHLPWTWRRCRPCLAVSSQKAATGRKFQAVVEPTRTSPRQVRGCGKCHKCQLHSGELPVWVPHLH